jgi:hypothetical protein
VSAENVIDFIEYTLIPKLTRARAAQIIAASGGMQKMAAASASLIHATRAARTAGIESDAVRFSERLRKAAWSYVWDYSQGDALAISLILARVGYGVATVDLVGDGEYDIEDYINLVEPWVSGFPDFPLPVKEDA